ncbi:MAG: ABC transporter permease [Oscillospiraceae bacterium]|nr:ABC transporter permease [Oscillospiraceae bacterium]
MATNMEGTRHQAAAIVKKYGIILVLLLMVIGLSIFQPAFRSTANIINILNHTAIFGIMAVGLTFVIISGGIDLSVGSVLAFSGVIMGAMSQTAMASTPIWEAIGPFPFIIALAACLAVGSSCGAVSGSLIAQTRIPPFIATLGMMTVARGLALIVTGGRPVSQLDPGFSAIGSRIMNNTIPVPVIIYLVVIALAWILLNNTKFGKSVYALGSNRAAAEISGINVKATLIKVYMLAGFLAGLAAIVFSARTLSAHPGAGTGYELTAIAATTIGGTSHSGGIGTMWGAVVGALVLAVLRNGLTLIGIHAHWQGVIEGAIIVVAVVIDMRKNQVKK